MSDTTQTILPPWTGQIVDEQTEPNTKEPIIQLYDCIPFPRYGIIEVADFQDILNKWQDGAVLYISKVRGAFLVVPVE